MSKKKVKSWDGSNCIITPVHNSSGEVIEFKGTYGNRMAYSVFHIRRQKQGEYLMRGHLSIRSMRDSSRVLSRMDRTPIAADIRVKTDDTETIMSRIEKAFNHLYACNYGAIYKDLGSARTDELTLFAAVKLYGKEYFIRSRRLSDRSISERLKGMERISVKLENYEMASIPQSALHRVCKPSEAGTAAKTAVNDLALFVLYLQNKSLYFGENPFVKFLNSHPNFGAKSTEQLIAEADREKSLPDEVMDRLDQKIREAPPDDTLTTGLLFVSHTGITLDYIMMKLHWRDIIFDAICDGSCQIRIWVDTFGGATHNYTRPGNAFFASEIRRRYLALLERDPDIVNKRVLGDVSRKKLVDYCRQSLLFAKMDYNEVLRARTSATSGGIRLLRSNFENRLLYNCGMVRASERDYMMMRRLSNDVTADNYASLSSPYGQMRLNLLLGRDTRYALPPETTRISVCPNTGLDGKQTQITVPANSPSHTTKIKVTLHMRPGQIFSAGAMGGLQIRTVMGVPEYENVEGPVEDGGSDA